MRLSFTTKVYSKTFPHISKIHHIPIKRIFDIFFSLTALICVAPVFLIIAALIAFTSPGPIIFSHQRVGRGGRLFSCFKFRTMYVDANEKLEEILANDPQAQKEWEANHKLKDDPRVTPLGCFLRKTSLDELPQFLNILKGDMSTVGPRALVSDEVHQKLGYKANKILSIRPGLTGVWQTSGRSNTSYQQRLTMDEEYIDKHNLWYDIYLILKTIPVMLFRHGAY
ncbi:MAG: sugar transferase [Chlamydiota bacterium]